MIRLKKIRLINWYGFSQITIPIGFFTLIAGKNGNGKSVLLDAIKYALYADVVFNKSTENTGKRTVVSYTRGLLDATAVTFMRPVEQMPNVYSHIVLEMEEVALGRVFILGTTIDTNASNGIVTRRYVIENEKLENIVHTYEDNGRIIPYSSVQLQKVLGVKMMDANEGVLKFMQRTGLRLNEQQLASFRRKLRSIMSYNPEAKIDQFIRESVLEDKKVDFSKLVETKKNIDSLNINFAVIDAEIKELNTIIELFDKLKNARNILLADDVKKAYKSHLLCTKEIEEAQKNMDLASRQMVEYEKQLELLSAREQKLVTNYREAKINLDSLDCSRAIQEAENALQNAKDEKDEFENEKQTLVEFQERVNKLLDWFKEQNEVVEQHEVLCSLTSKNFSKIEKEISVDKLLKKVKKQRDEILAEITRIKDKISANRDQQSRLQQQINNYNAKKTTFSEIPNYVALKNEINKEFEKRGIVSEARFACEFVIALTDESWRDAIESYVGRRRYTILVEPEYYDIADDVFNYSNNKYAHLFNTKLLMNKNVTVEEDSVVRFIEVKNPVAKQYFNYQLGRFHATLKDKVKHYENAISINGRISVAMDSFFLRFDKIRFYCLGQKAIELNRIKATKEMASLKAELEELTEQLQHQKLKQAYLETGMTFFGQFNFDACLLYEEALINYANKQGELERLIDAQKNNVEYIELAKQVSRLERDFKAVDREKEEVRENKSLSKSRYSENEKLLKENQATITKINSQLIKLETSNYAIYEKAIEDYKKHLANGPGSLGGILKDRERAERLVKQMEKELTTAQASYNASKSTDNRLPLSDESRAEYESRKSRIWMDDLQEIQQKLKEQTKRYEKIFKNEFVLTVLKFCEAAIDDLKLINSELARLKFKSKYAFDIKYVKDGSDYGKILEYANYLKEREELGTTPSQLTFDSMTSYSNDKGEELEREIRKIINRIIENNDKNQIEHFADYRNYMTYEILLANDILKSAKLSKQSGYNSGAEVQIPYMLILLSALLMIYNDKLNSTRLVFIDEPFAKMDPTNIKIMLGFMKEQNLQMIFCAPDKTELIGNECEVILPVLRTQADLMEIGIVEIHKGV
ncbi:SbcC/MukB-like Walker B domain-containing protein [Rummeliibacillus suwonensis]|uniref:SbcC/MukB-like Walker B domain-containing protein n=1 Tax=Rummeliibacillus suwonensis TaxID=1306154 RepID=UPI001AAE6753|nr:SbcC/MukB-like Walker B domain-containing protein [Rummeliibacillus suwonensis]MBO2536541.1 hypothetical protein [Rummeliibacillus suwonensis]